MDCIQIVQLYDEQNLPILLCIYCFVNDFSVNCTEATLIVGTTVFDALPSLPSVLFPPNTLPWPVWTNSNQRLLEKVLTEALSCWLPRFNPRSGHEGSGLTKWHWGRLSPSTLVSAANSHSTICSMFINHSYHRRSTVSMLSVKKREREDWLDGWGEHTGNIPLYTVGGSMTVGKMWKDLIHGLNMLSITYASCLGNISTF
jgi:hypothetical protein